MGEEPSFRNVTSLTMAAFKPISSPRGIPMRTFYRSLAAVTLAAVAATAIAQEVAQVYKVPADAPAHISRAVASPERTDEMRSRDFNRKPAEVMMIAGLEEGDRVIEIASFGHYFTTMLTAAVGPSGMVYMFDLPYTEARAGEAARKFDADHANAEYHLANYNDAQLPQGVDAVWNILYYHDLGLNDIDTAAFNKKIYDALKPGGVYVVVDHKAEDGSGTRDSRSIHRIDAATIKQEVLAAGFELARESDLLANPDDDRKAMVFAPGTRGTTDQAFFVFRKPAR
jgi:predicted methyltransferase